MVKKQGEEQREGEKLPLKFRSQTEISEQAKSVECQEKAKKINKWNKISLWINLIL